MQKQSDLINNLTDRELTLQVYLSQMILFLTGVLFSLYLFDGLGGWFNQLIWNPVQIIYYGLGTGVIIVGFDLFLMYILPFRMYDDGGINQRLFKNRSFTGISLLTMLVSISEEVLFRGVLHASFSYGLASTVFALVHIRYLTKPVLFISVLFVSFYIGYVYEITGNLLVAITAHFTVDCVLGFLIRIRKWGISK